MGEEQTCNTVPAMHEVIIGKVRRFANLIDTDIMSYRMVRWKRVKATGVAQGGPSSGECRIDLTSVGIARVVGSITGVRRDRMDDWEDINAKMPSCR